MVGKGVAAAWQGRVSGGEIYLTICLLQSSVGTSMGIVRVTLSDGTLEVNIIAFLHRIKQSHMRSTQKHYNVKWLHTHNTHTHIHIRWKQGSSPEIATRSCCAVVQINTWAECLHSKGTLDYASPLEDLPLVYWSCVFWAQLRSILAAWEIQDFPYLEHWELLFK